MRKLLSVGSTAVLTFLLSACGDEGSDPTGPLPAPDVAAAISDATHGDVPDRNPGFWWLAPMVAQPTLTGTFQSKLSPRVKVILCAKSTDPAVTCEGGKPAVESPSTPGTFADFTRGAGLVTELDHFKVNFDTRAFGLEPTVSGDSTTYRILAFTDPLADFGGPFVLGYADFQVAETGSEVKNLSAGDTTTIGLVDGRTLPIRFFINEDAYPAELKTNTAPAGDAALCQVNCSVTVVPADETTEASLFRTEDGTETELTAILFQAGDVQQPSVLVIDERAPTDASCAPGVNVRKSDCFRYEITPDLPFNNPVRVGVCPLDVPAGERSLWRILKADDGVLTRPPEAFVSDFLTCPSRTALLHRVLDWFVTPLFASDADGAQIQQLSDLFWGRDAEASQVSASGDTVVEGTAVPMTVQVVGTHPEPDVPLEGEAVDFLISAGAGSLAAPAGATPASTTLADDGVTVVGMRLLTDANGEATVDWTVGAGGNTLTASTPDAEGGPISFEVTATPAAVVVGPETRITTDPATQFLPDVDGRRVVWQDTRNNTVHVGNSAGDIYLHDLADGTETRLTNGSGFAGRPAISGTWIVWQHQTDAFGGCCELFLHDLASGSTAQLTFNSVRDQNPDISGNRIVYSQTVEGEGWSAVHLQEMHSLTSSTVTRLTPKRVHAFGVANYAQPRISGDRVVWQDSRHDGQWDIYTLDLSTGVETRITDNPANQGQPAVSGDRIVWVDERNGNSDIYLFDFAIGVEQPIATGAANQNDPDISGDLIVWTESDPDGSTQSQVYVHDLASGTTAQVSSSMGASTLGGRVPAVAGDRVVWADLPDGNWDIFTATATSGGAP